jgi:antitoxin (DNA-binding transcriptional repressor) of toxin-antitoxin stability system
MCTHEATLPDMRMVGLRELKNSLSEVIRQVRAGEEVLVTDRGEVVAEIRQPAPPGANRDPHPGLAALARRGSLILGAPNDPALYTPSGLRLPEGTAASLLDEERADRFS